MALKKTTVGEDYIRTYNIKPYKQETGYTGAVGDLVKLSTVSPDAVQRCANGNALFGIVHSTNSGNGTLSVIELNGGVVIQLEFENSAGELAIGDGVVKSVTGGTVHRGTLIPTKDWVKKGASGQGFVLAVSTDTTYGQQQPAGATVAQLRTAMIRFGNNP